MLSRFNTEPEFRKQLNALVDHSISPEEFSVLEQRIQTDGVFLSDYVEFIYFVSELQRFSEEKSEVVETPQNSILWQLLCDDEKTAEVLDVPAPDDAGPSCITPLPRQKIERHYSKPFVISVFASVAALFFLMVYFHLNPVQRAPIVARTGQSINARFASPNWPQKAGSDLRAGPGVLLEGVAEIRFDSGATVILQAPTEFEIEDTMQIRLNSGRLVAGVPKRAIGFTVVTPDATVVDYGTEFGVAVDTGGQTQAHVFKGQIELRTGPDTRVYEHSRRLLTGQAGKVEQGIIVEAFLATSHFFRYVPSLYDITARKMGPISFWRFDPRDGGVFVNDLFNEQHSVSSSSLSRVSEPFAGLGSALYFSGRDGQGFSIHENNPVEGSDEYTFCFWIRPRVLRPQVVAVSRISEEKDVLRRFLVINEQHQFEYYYTTTNRPTKTNPVSSTTSLKPDQWYHLVLTGSLSKHRLLYLNGNFEATSPQEMGTGKSVPVHDFFTLGQVEQDMIQDNFSPFSGYIGTILRFDRELSADEIQIGRASCRERVYI